MVRTKGRESSRLSCLWQMSELRAHPLACRWMVHWPHLQASKRALYQLSGDHWQNTGYVQWSLWNTGWGCMCVSEHYLLVPWCTKFQIIIFLPPSVKQPDFNHFLMDFISKKTAGSAQCSQALMMTPSTASNTDILLSLSYLEGNTCSCSRLERRRPKRVISIALFKRCLAKIRFDNAKTRLPVFNHTLSDFSCLCEPILRTGNKYCHCMVQHFRAESVLQILFAPYFFMTLQ